MNENTSGEMDLSALLADAPTNSGSQNQKPDANVDDGKGQSSHEPAPKQPTEEGKQEQSGGTKEKKEVKAEEPKTATPPQVDPRDKQISDLQAQVTALLTRAAQQPQKEAEQKEQKPQADAPKFNVRIPDEILAGMSSEDEKERATATTFLINGAMNFLWREVSTLLETKLTEMQRKVPEVVDSRQSMKEQQKQVFEDFYAAFPKLKKAELFPLVSSQAQVLAKEMMQATGTFSWTQEFRDKLGQHVMNLLGIQAETAPQEQPPKKQAPATEAKPQPFQAGRTTRQSGGDGKNAFLDSLGM